MKLHHRLWVVWSIGLAAYLVGVMHRTSFGVAGLDAAARFHAAPAMLAGFVVLQLLVYAILQIPVGVLLDRFGARKLIVVGALTMAAGQLVLAVAADLPLAILARVLVGAGDALTFIPVLPVVTSWVPPRRGGVLTRAARPPPAPPGRRPRPPPRRPGRCCRGSCAPGASRAPGWASGR